MVKINSITLTPLEEFDFLINALEKYGIMEKNEFQLSRTERFFVWLNQEKFAPLLAIIIILLPFGTWMGIIDIINTYIFSFSSNKILGAITFVFSALIGLLPVYWLAKLMSKSSVKLSKKFLNQNKVIKLFSVIKKFYEPNSYQKEFKECIIACQSNNLKNLQTSLDKILDLLMNIEATECNNQIKKLEKELLEAMLGSDHKTSENKEYEGYL